jgi:tetratricopeptide (TPR) repeat protein
LIKPLFSLRNFIFLLIGTGLFQSCSSEKNAPLNKAFHNTTSYYNAYFIGLQHIRDIEASILANLNPEYDKILWVYPPLDSSMATTYKTQLEDCIKKASLVIQYHKNSKWVDDSYNLIGQARMYGYDFPNAITTFKYVNTKGEDHDARHWAIVNLMRTFIENGDMANAEAASDFLEQEILNKQNLKHLYLTRAYYYQKMDDKDNMVRNLVRASPLLSRTERARIYFIIAQVYQEIGFQSAAYEYYRKCIGSHPEYELSFYAKLNIASVTKLNDQGDLRAVRKYFKKLVKDEKNIEFKDRIYYELARFEFRQGNLVDALKNFNLSIQNSVSNPKQKGLSYLRLGQIYYDTLKDYSIAQAYYDSAVTSLPTTYEDYLAIKQRSEVLDDFVEQINTITLQDSLLTLSAKDSTELMGIFVSQATAEDEARKLAAEKSREKQRASTVFGTPNQPSGIGGNSLWYFGNPSAVSAGKSTFRQLWGNRILEDHWRRSVKQTNESNTTSEQLSEDLPENNTENTGILAADRINNSASEMFSQVPRTEEELAETLSKIENAYYRLGNIYYFELEEKENAVTTFNTFLNRFPKSEFKPEVLYQLYLINSELDSTAAEQVKDELLEKYPNSIYTKLILNPEFEEQSNIDNEALIASYQDAYRAYELGAYDSAYAMLEKERLKHAELLFAANMRLLQILIIGKTKPLSEYQLALKAFIQNNPDHPIKGYAEELLAASDSYRSSLVKLKEATFATNFEELHFFVATTTFEEINSLVSKLQQFIDSNFTDSKLSVGTLTLSNEINLIIVRAFPDKVAALYFYDTLKAIMIFDDSKNDNFVITATNFELLYESKELENYLTFFELNY